MPRRSEWHTLVSLSHVARVVTALDLDGLHDTKTALPTKVFGSKHVLELWYGYVPAMAPHTIAFTVSVLYKLLKLSSRQ